MTMRKKRDVARKGTQAGDQSVCAGGKLIGRFAIGGSVFEYRPPRLFAKDVFGELAFMVTVVPFGKVGLDLGDRRQGYQRAGLPCTFEWAGEHLTKWDLPQICSQVLSFIPTVFRQWNICDSCVLTADGPGSFPMTDEVEFQRAGMPVIFIVNGPIGFIRSCDDHVVRIAPGGRNILRSAVLLSFVRKSRCQEGAR